MKVPGAADPGGHDLSPDRAPISVVVLAAGTASRFGGGKLLADVGGVALVRAVVLGVLRSRALEVIVVVGADGERVRDALSDLPVRFVANARFAEGMSTSLRASLPEVDSSAQGAVIALGDQPGADERVIDRLIGAWEAGAGPIVAPRYRDRLGQPVLFTRPMFDELFAVQGDEGGRSVVGRDASRVVSVAIPFDAPHDVDTFADLSAVRAELGHP